MKNKKVIFIATVVKMHIMEFHIPFLRMFKEMGWETAVAAKNDYEDIQNCVIPYCDRFYNIPFERNPFNHNNIKSYKVLKRILEQDEYNIIHCHTPVGGVVGRLAAKSIRKSGKNKVVYTAHGFHFYKGAPLKNWLLYYPVEKFFSRWTDALVLINQEDYKRAERKFKAKKTYYVPGVGIDLNRYKKCIENDDIRDEFNIPSKAKVILSVGEVNNNKNHKLGITSISKLNDDSIYYIICGQGNLIEENRKLAKALGVNNRVIFAGYRSDVERFYNTADIFLFPSLREGLSVSMMEAMAMGVPIICNSIRGNTDLIDDGINGVLINNTVEEAVEAIKLLLHNSSLRESISMAEREKIEQFGLDNVMDKMRNIYFEVED